MVLSLLSIVVILSCCHSFVIPPIPHQKQYKINNGDNHARNHLQASFMNDFFGKTKSVESDIKDGDSVLRELNITTTVEPKRFYASPSQLPNVVAAVIPTLFRFGSGIFSSGYQISIASKDPSKYSIATFFDKFQISETTILPRKQVSPIVLYEFESCPFCRKVREAVTMLSLDVVFKPCPKEGQVYRRDIKSTYGNDAKFPFLVDPNTGIEMFESDDIISYLFNTYGTGSIPWTLDNSVLATLTAGIGLLFRPNGLKAVPSNPPRLEDGDEPLILFSYEGSPFCKIVKEKLCELQICHKQISCPRGSPNRQVLYEHRKGKNGEKLFQVPYLQDPNTGVELFESEIIIEYLQKQYSVEPSPVKYL